jgi:hypothetical protein
LQKKEFRVAGGGRAKMLIVGELGSSGGEGLAKGHRGSYLDCGWEEESDVVGRMVELAAKRW